MKLLSTVGLLAVTGILLAQSGDVYDNYNPPNPAGGAVGRFQLVSATICTDENTKPIPMMMRIDTTTGRVWFYQRVAQPVPGSNGQTVMAEGWTMTAENYFKSIEESKRVAFLIHSNEVRELHQ